MMLQRELLRMPKKLPPLPAINDHPYCDFGNFRMSLWSNRGSSEVSRLVKVHGSMITFESKILIVSTLCMYWGSPGAEGVGKTGLSSHRSHFLGNTWLYLLYTCIKVPPELRGSVKQAVAPTGHIHSWGLFGYLSYNIQVLLGQIRYTPAVLILY